LRRKRIRIRGDSPELSFNVGGTWAWSLRVYQGSELAGVMQAASPLTCLTVLSPYFEQGRSPQAPYKLLIRCNSSKRQLKIDRRIFDRLAGHHQGDRTDQTLALLADHFERDPSSLGDSTCVTVMTDRDGEVVDSTALLHRAFGLEAPSAAG
jgi:hypothetical protein